MSEDNNVSILDPNKFFKISGKVENIRERVYNDKVTQYVMIEDVSNAEYPNYFEVEFYGDKAKLVSPIKVGDYVTCNINFGGRKWIDKNTGEINGAFFSLKGWKITIGDETAQYQRGGNPEFQAPVYTPPVGTESASEVIGGGAPDEDCPFAPYEQFMF